MEQCPFCAEYMQHARTNIPDSFSVNCPRCGEYQITGSAIAVSRGGINPREGSNISGWLRENQGSQITSNNLSILRSQRTPSFHDRADKLLMALEKKTSYAGEYIEYENSWISMAWCVNGSEITEVLNFLKASNRIEIAQGAFIKYKISPDGWKHLEQLKKINIDSQQGFVAMWFDNDLKKVYDDIIAPAILAAGYKPHRVDQREHNNKIDDEIIAEIRRSRFVLADFTGHRGGVYFEAGFSKGLGMEVFWTC